MHIQEIEFESIDLEDEAFRVSEDLDPPAVRDSVNAIGLLNPVLLLQRHTRYRIISGFRRIRAARSLGMPSITARILEENGCDPLWAYTISIRDNISHRKLSPLENARILYKLHEEFGLPEAKLIREYMPLLGLNPAEPVLRSYLLLHQIHPALRQCLGDGRLTLASIEALSDMLQSTQDKIAALMGQIRLSASLQKKLLALLGDLAAATGCQPDVVFDRHEIISIAEDRSLSPFQKGEKVYEWLYRLRNPRLSQATDQFLARRKRLQLSGSIRVTAHPFFEEPGLRVEFDAPDAKRFRELAASLHQSAESTEFEELFKI